jgi:hypothetical protein
MTDGIELGRLNATMWQAITVWLIWLALRQSREIERLRARRVIVESDRPAPRDGEQPQPGERGEDAPTIFERRAARIGG